jgi:hypothetical protein
MMENATLNTTNVTSGEITSATATVIITASTYMLLLIGAAGVIGNILTIRLLVQQAKKKGIYFMFLLLALCDLIYIVLSLVYVSALNLSGGTINIVYLSGCHVAPLASFVCSELSSWLLVLITIERITICYFPHRTLFSHRSIALYITCITITLLVINFPYFGGLQAKLQAGVLEACYGRSPAVDYYYMVVYRKLEFTVYCLIPAGLLLILNVALIHKLHRIKSQVSPTQMNVNELQTISSREQSGTQSRPLPTAITIQAAHTVKTLLRLCKTTVLLSLMFILLTFPLAMVNLVSYDPAMLSEYGTGIYLALNVTFVLSFCNHCINCVLYCLSGSKYRQQLLKLVTCKHRAQA